MIDRPSQEMEDDDWDSLPPQLTPVGLESSASDVGPDGATRRLSEVLSMSSSEQSDVHHFIRTHQNNSGIIDLLNEYLIALARQWNAKWYVHVHVQCL